MEPHRGTVFPLFIDNIRTAVARPPRRPERPSSLPAVSADLVANHTANCGTAHGSKRVAARKSGSTDGTNTGSDRGIAVSLGHAGTTGEAQQHHCGQSADRMSLDRIHLITSFSNIGFHIG
jgi:hypothetical protein